MIVSICSDKGAPGVSTLAVVLGLVWPGRRVVVEADTAGSDLSFRLRPTATDSGVLGGHLAPEPSIASLATAARLGLAESGPLPYAQDTTLGVPVVPGVLSAERFRALRGLWPKVGTELAGWSGTVLADLGRLQPGNPAMAVAQSSTAVLLLAAANLEGLYHVRDRVTELSAVTGDPGRRRPSLGVVVTGELRDRRSSCEQVRQVLASIGSPAPVIGFVARDPAAARGLWAGELTRRFTGSDLVRTARSLAESVLATWPELVLVAPEAGDPLRHNQFTNNNARSRATTGSVMQGARS